MADSSEIISANEARESELLCWRRALRFEAGQQLRRIPSLDGLSAISIILVLLAHLAGSRNFPFTRQINATGELGFLGVRVFFHISGFLITTILLDEIRSE